MNDEDDEDDKDDEEEDAGRGVMGRVKGDLFDDDEEEQEEQSESVSTRLNSCG
jgi:U3 small nucleolar RNA-associated protein MPP10